MSLVKYFFVGPQKTGTTWIYEVLKTLPSINLSNQTKELEFFNKNFGNGISWYHDAFQSNGSKTCDISTSYFTSKKAWSRIKKYNPDAKIIVTIRHPVKRLISHYKHNIRFGIIKRIPINEALIKYPDLLENSLYAKFIKIWIREFGQENVLILPLELLSKDSESFLKMLETFLDIKIDLNITQYKNKINYAGQPKSYFLAKTSRILRRRINALGFHGIIKAAKKLGLKKLIYEGGKEIVIEESAIDNLKYFFKSDIYELREYGIRSEIIDEYIDNNNVI